MPTAPLLLLPLKRLLSLIPSVLGLFPVLLRPPPMAARLSPLALPPFVPRLPTFALRPLAFLPTPSNHPRRHPGVRSRDPAAPNNPGPPSHPDLPNHPKLAIPPIPTAPQTPPKSTPRRLKSFLEKTLTARETPTSAHSSHPHQRIRPAPHSSRLFPSSRRLQPGPSTTVSPSAPMPPRPPQHPEPTSPSFLTSHFSPLTPSSPPPSRRSPAPKNPPNLATAGREHP